MSNGIRTIEHIRLRCWCDPDTKCWNWRGVTSKQHERPKEPRVYLADTGQITTLGRASWKLGRGPLDKGTTVWRRCRNDLCANPNHMLSGTKADWGAWTAKAGFLRGRPERAAINRRIKFESGQARLTMELAQWVRESTQTGRAVAQALECSETLVSRVRLRRTYAPPKAASVFSWGGVA